MKEEVNAKTVFPVHALEISDWHRYEPAVKLSR
jgi:hypothetical protein